MLEVKNLTKVYRDGTVGCKDVSLEIPKEHIFAILGTSGAGKTTLLQCLSRFLEPTSGQILIDGQDAIGFPMKEFRQKIGIVFQHLHLFPHKTVLENMTLAPTTVYGVAEPTAVSNAKETLAQLGIPELSDSYPSQISGGQAQRVAIGRALLLKPSYLLLDEPTSALDINTTRDFSAWLTELKAETTFIIVTHDLEFARDTAQHAVLMEGGSVTSSGTVDEVATKWTAPAN